MSWNLIEKPALRLKVRATHAPASTTPAEIVAASS